jgi:segregation and condensation protein B
MKKERRALDKKEQKAVLEAILFTMGESVEVDRLAEVIELNIKETRELLLELQKDYGKKDRGITLIELDGAFQMCTKAEMYEYLVKIAKTHRKLVLTDAVLETLSIIAYKQPVTKSEIEKIRGVSCDHAVNKLLEYELVMEVGRMDAPGRPILFGTTEQFLRSFGVKSLGELPEMNPDRVEEFREEAEKEVQIQLDV